MCRIPDCRADVGPGCLFSSHSATKHAATAPFAAVAAAAVSTVSRVPDELLRSKRVVQQPKLFEKLGVSPQHAAAAGGDCFKTRCHG